MERMKSSEEICRSPEQEAGNSCRENEKSVEILDTYVASNLNGAQWSAMDTETDIESQTSFNCNDSVQPNRQIQLSELWDPSNSSNITISNDSTQFESTGSEVMEEDDDYLDHEDDDDDDEYFPSNDDDDDDYNDVDDEVVERCSSAPKKKGQKRARTEHSVKGNKSIKRLSCKKTKDDGDEYLFEKRLKAYERKVSDIEMDFFFVDHRFKIPTEIWNKCYDYQKEGVLWLWKLHEEGAGGILADEMGLGKTLQLIAFMSGLYYSKLHNKFLPSFRGLGPCLIVCPTTVMHQWLKELHQHLPPIRVALLHVSGTFTGSSQDRRKLIRSVYKCGGILITSYVGIVRHQEQLTLYDWHLVILDEGHQIRNPDTKVTKTAKALRTPHRYLLSGTPVQNNLKELWSLFDFVFPSKLGSLQDFLDHFSIPITRAGYANATNEEDKDRKVLENIDKNLAKGYECARKLKHTICGYLLRRLKRQVTDSITLPEKSERTLLCRPTDEQISAYRSYVNSDEVGRILDGRLKLFVGLRKLRDICNHPNLFADGPTCSMLLLLELYVRSMKYPYLKMDGTTCISSRQPLIDSFNQLNSEYFVMLLTTKVGGLGVNLTSADRVLIYDPDWNPATDTQAQQRAWRIGQNKPVTAYRLLTAGTIEEKMYHRQIFKELLSNKVLNDAKHKRFFKSNSLLELFAFTECSDHTETEDMLVDTNSKIDEARFLNSKIRCKQDDATESKSIHFSEEKIEKMKEMARLLSKKLQPLENTYDSVSQPAESKEQSTNRNREVEILKKRLKLHKHRNRLKTGPNKEPQDEYVLKKLFSKLRKHVANSSGGSGGSICSALEHDSIMRENTTPDPSMVERRAARLVQRLIFTSSSHRTSAVSSNSTPTNDTRQAAGLPIKRKNTMLADRETLSSNDVLQAINERNSNESPSDLETKIVNNLTDFLRKEGGTVSTDVLVSKFQSELPVSMTALFKCLLNSVCSFKRTSTGVGMWTLKDKYK